MSDFIKEQIQRLKGARLNEPHKRAEYNAEIEKLEKQLSGDADAEAQAEADEQEREEIRTYLNEKGVEFHPALGLKKLRILKEKTEKGK